MFTYVVILFTINLIVLGYTASQDSERFLTQVVALLIHLPIFGRILGWW